MSTVAKAVFLSYASQDAEAARRICDALRAVDVEVWFDQSELRGGDAWDASIRRQIKECALFVPIISANTQAREEGYFRLEWKLAVDRTHVMADDKAFLLPVVIDATADDRARAGEIPRGAMDAPARGRGVGGLRRAGAAAAVGWRCATAHCAAAAPATADSSHGPPSIAVLPFVNRSHDEDDEYFSDGLADELLNVLAKIRGLRVAARSSAFTFKGKGDHVAEVGRALNVATVLEGSVRKAGNRVRISVQLVKVADGYHLWSETYDRTLEDIFAVQDDIAQSVVKELRTTLLGEAADAKASGEVTAEVAAAVKGRARPGGAPALPAGSVLHRSRQPRGHGEGDRVPEAGAGAGSGVRARLGGAGRRVRERSGYGLDPGGRGVSAGAGGGGARARAGAGSGGGARGDGVDPDGPTTGTGAVRRRPTAGPWSWRRGNARASRRAGALATSLGRLDEAIAFVAVRWSRTR